MKRRRWRLGTAAMCWALACAIGAGAQDSSATPGVLLAHESFEDTSLTSRGWYDGVHLETVADSTAPHGGFVNLWHWPAAGAISPAGGSARLRLPPATDVTVSFQLRLSPNWAWTGRGYHPHMITLITNADDAYVGPAFTHLTTYVEIVDGIPRVTLQDGRNVLPDQADRERSDWIAEGAVAGCNGDADGHGVGDCYRSGENWLNGKVWAAPSRLLPSGDTAWHEIRARYRLNTVGEVVVRDGVLQLWFDGVQVVNVADAVLRTTRHPEMAFNQLFVGPYYGPGVPHEQWIRVDDLRVWARAPEQTTVEVRSWGRVKGDASP